MTEFEKKLILSEDEYNHLMKHLGQDKMTVTQINYYFDTDDFDMNRENTTCRIRLKNGKYMATMKLHSEGNDNSTEIDLLIRNGIYDNTFIDMGLKLQGELITKRCLILQDDICEVVLDKNDYLGHTVGTLYDCYGSQIVEVDDYEPCGKINFRIIQNLTSGNTYYIKVATKNNEVGSYTLRATDSVLANSVDINNSSITLEKGVTYELPITPNYTYKGYNGAQRIPGLSVTIDPSNATEQKIWWWEQHRDILECYTDWDDDGDRYFHVITKKAGVTKLYARDWKSHGKLDECTINVPKVTVISCSPNSWVESSKTMGIDMSTEFNCAGSYIVGTPTNASDFTNYWNKSDECVIIHTHGSPTGLSDHGENSTPRIISKDEIANLPQNNNIHFIMMTACETAGGTTNDNVAYWLSKKINPNGIVIANTDVVSGDSKSFHGKNNNRTWKIYKNGIIQDPICDVTLTMESAYDIYQLYK